MVMVCDSIMGSGKSSACITYINEHPDQKFIYITPYLDEANRIKRNCVNANFVEPSNKLEKYNYRKTDHTAALIHEGRNITTTHQAFKGYDQNMLDDIKTQGYTLIIDENMDVLQQFDISEGDLRLAVDAGYVKEENNIFTLARDDYNGVLLRDLFEILRSRELIKTCSDGRDEKFYWALPAELVTSFRNVFILTYMFEGQGLHHFLSIYGIPYERIGVEHVDGNRYRFCDYPGQIPEYTSHIRDMIHILDDEKINSVGDDYHALSIKWFERGGKDVEQLRRNVSNCYKNIWGDIPADRRMWGSYKGAFNKMRGKGYTKAFLTFNARATNQYKERDCLVYIANIFMNVSEKCFYTMHGIEVDEDAYALSIMVQWIWRSAIREGREVNIYVPSRRMRELLIGWMDSLAEGGGSG